VLDPIASVVDTATAEATTRTQARTTIRTPAHVEVRVAILGPTRVVGAARPFTRSLSRELVVYLATHPDGASTDRWATALWPERTMAPSTLHSTASSARRALGRSRLGHDHLPKRHGRLQLGPSVATDLQCLTMLAACDDPSAWQSALALVRGRPFEGLLSPDWAVMEGAVVDAEEVVVGLAIRIADHLLVSGDPDGAAWAVRRGLLASPYDERLFRRLLQTADAQGNPAGVESAMAELALRLGWEPSPSGEVTSVVHPETAELYRALSRHGGAARAGGRATGKPGGDSTRFVRPARRSRRTEEPVGRL
jgi:hypothetical protein